MKLEARPPVTTASISGNWPIYDEKGRRMVIRECRRTPTFPFRVPRCHDKRTRRIGFDTYRCQVCAARIKPERLWHRLLLNRNPFRPDGTWRDLFYVTRWAPYSGYDAQ